MQASTPLAALMRPSAYRETRGHIFPSEGSLEWFARTHRDELRRFGALVEVGGRVFVHAQRFDEYVLNGGKVAA